MVQQKLIKKTKKLIRDPKLFFKDSKLFNKISLNKFPINIKGNSITDNSSFIKPFKQEPSIIGSIQINNNKLIFDYIDKQVKNSTNGFSTLFMYREEKQGLLIHKPYINLILKNRNFISFKDKSLYFLINKTINNEDIVYSESEIYTLFKENQILRSNKLQDFRNIVELNPLSIESILLKNSNPNLKLIYIVDNKESLDFITNYKKEIDVLIYFDKLNTSYISNIPRIVSFSNSQSFINVFKTVLIDTSYKIDSNFFIPVLCNTDNLDNLDKYNEMTKINGLIDLNYKLKNYTNFEDIILDEDTIINNFLLKENIYSLYKDQIFKSKTQKDFKELLLHCLKEGVFFEKI